jgi:hypothetical protein
MADKISIGNTMYYRSRPNAEQNGVLEEVKVAFDKEKALEDKTKEFLDK